MLTHAKTEDTFAAMETGHSTWENEGQPREVRVSLGGQSDDIYKGSIWLDTRSPEGYTFVRLSPYEARKLGTFLIELSRDAERNL